MLSMLTHGSARIGTLFDWRKTSEYGELISDSNEAHTMLTGNLGFYDTTFINSLIVDSWVGPEENRATTGVPFRNEAVRAENHYAFSASTTYSERDHQRWYELEGYDACYRIHSARLFFKALTRSTELSALAQFVCAAPIHYFDESLPNNVFRGTFHPALIKRSTFGGQFEFRALWKPKTAAAVIEPVLVFSSRAKLYVSSHVILSGL